MLPKRPLTDRGIAALKPAKGAYQLAWDALVPGLAVRVTATGAKSFVLVTRYPGPRARQSRSNPAFHSSTMTAAMTSAVPMNAATISMIYLLRATVFSMIL